MMRTGDVVVIGAGPAGLTAAQQLIERTRHRPVVLERGNRVGGLAATVAYRGNRLDIGGHRFFSKSDWVMSWWLERLPLQRLPAGEQMISYQGKTRRVAGSAGGPDPATEDRVMLLRRRRSRIYWQRQFFAYPLRLTGGTLRNLGLVRVARLAASYGRAALFPLRPEENLEQFFINRFGRELFQTFFRAYTEKVWGRPCAEISAAWGAQRVKGLDAGKAVWDFVRKSLLTNWAAAQRAPETSLIGQFLYPKYGPGQMWEAVAREVQTHGGAVVFRQRVDRLLVRGRRVVAVEAVDEQTGERQTHTADHVLSTMPVPELVASLDVPVPVSVRAISEGLQFRDFITVGLLVKHLRVNEADGSPLRDNWIYIQEPDVRVGRLQIFNNWSPWMVADPERTMWLGLEYFCSVGDDLWPRSDAQMIELGIQELWRIGLLSPQAVLDATVMRVPKAYPAYFGSYDRFGELRAWLDRFENLWLLGRNGMHRYNNQDHSMLAAKAAVDAIAAGRCDKQAVWGVNEEKYYLERKPA